MSMDPRSHTTDGGHHQQSARSWSAWSPAPGTSDERTAIEAATSGGATTTTHTRSSAAFNGAALLLDAAARASRDSTPSNHGLVAPTMHTITSKQQKAMTMPRESSSANSKASAKNRNTSNTFMKYSNPSSMATMTSGSAHHHKGDDMLATAGDPTCNSKSKSSSRVNANNDDGMDRLYATIYPGFWGVGGRATTEKTKILVKIRMKKQDGAQNPSALAGANDNAQLYATLPAGFWKTEGKKMATTSTKVRVKIIQTKDATKKLLAPSKKKATDVKATTKAKKKDKDLPAGVRRKDDKYMLSVCLPGIGGSRTIAAFATKETAIEAQRYANAKVQDIRLQLGSQKLETKHERDAKLSEVKAHVTESITNKILTDAAFTPPPPSTAMIKHSTTAEPDEMGANPACISDIPHNDRPPAKSAPSTHGTIFPVKKRANQVLHDMSAEEAAERANQGPPNADRRRSNKSKADEKSLPLKKRRLIIFEESPQKQSQEDVREQVGKQGLHHHHLQQQQDAQIQPTAKEDTKANNLTRPSPQLSTASSRFVGTSPSQSFITDQAMKLRSTLNELINNGVIEWRPSGLSFMIKKPDFLRASDFTTFSAFGFDQIRSGDDLGALIHPNYRRDQPSLPLMPTRRSAKTNYCLSIAQDRYGSGMFLDVVIPRRSISNPCSSFGIDLTYDADGWTRVYTRTGQHGWLRDGDIIHAVNGEKMFLPNSLMFSPSHQQKPMLHAIVVMACRRTPSGMPMTLRLFRENKSALSTSI